MENEKHPERILKILSIVLGLSLIVLLIVIKINIPDFSLRWVIILVITTLVISSLTYFGFEISNNIKERFLEKKDEDTEKLKINTNNAIKIAKEMLFDPDYADYLKEIKKQYVINVGKIKRNTIFVIEGSGVYEPQSNYCILINMNHPELRAILKNPSHPEISRIISKITLDPSEEPDIEERREYDPLTGREIQIKRRTKKKEEKHKKEEDLA